MNWKEWDIDWQSIDLVLSGSPCQDLSIAGKRAGINGKRSSLFWVFIDIYNHIKVKNPNVLFFQENVGSAPKKDIGIMSRALGVYPVRFNSSLVTAQLRDRYYWTNIKVKEFGMFGDLVVDIPPPKDRKVMFKDIIENGVTDREKSTCVLEGYGRNNFKNNDSKKAQKYLKSRDAKGMCPLVYIENDEVRVAANTVKGYDVATEDDCINLSFPKSKTRRARVTKGKSPCLLEGDEKLYTLKDFKVRTLTKTELCRLQGFPDDYCEILSRNQAASLLGDGWTLPMIEHFFKYLKNAK